MNATPKIKFPGTLIVLGTAAAVFLVVVVICISRPRGVPEPPPPPAKNLEQQLELRAALDAGLWKQETLAQLYEQRIVRLWDALRQSSDKLAILSAFPFTELMIPDESSVEPLENGIQGREFSGSDQTYSPEQFRARMQELTGAGYHLVQTEWHHQAFDFDETTRRAASEVSFSLHVIQPREQRRVIVKGVLKIAWEPMVEAGVVPEPGRIEARQISFLERTGRPAFLKVAEIDARKMNSRVLSVQPLIVYDLNRDGLSEVILGGVNAVFWNQGGGKFRQAPLLSHPPGEIGEAALVADFNGDGWVDFLCVTAKDLAPVLFAGDEQGLFQTPGFRASTVSVKNPSVLATGDIDNDGDLDLWLTQYRGAYSGGQMPTPYYDANDGYPSYLLLNRGDGKFDEVTELWGLDGKRNRRTYASSFADLDGDHDLDLLVVSDFAGGDLYRNDGGKFTDVRDGWVDEWHNFGMSHTLDDFDLDGRLDFYVIGMSSTTARRLDKMDLHRDEFRDYSEQRSVMGFGNRMYLNRSGRFDEPKFKAEVARTGWSWGCSSFDIENDGDPDIYVANGYMSGASCQDYCSTYWRHDLYTGSSKEDPVIQQLLDQSMSPVHKAEISWNGYEKNALLMNRDGRGFTDISFLMNVALPMDCRGVVSDDLDGDGLADLLVVERWSEPGFKEGQILHVFANQSAPENHWIGFRLEEQGRKGHAIGAKVTLRSGSRTRVGHVVVGDSYFSQHAPVVHFGLGDATSVDQVEIRWPDGRSTLLEKPEIDRYHTVLSDGGS